MTQLQKLNSIRLCLSAHPDNEVGSEFSDRISDLDELIQAQENADSTLLDDLAKAAMHGMLTTPKGLPEMSGKRLAEMAYTYADFMMQERERRMKG